MASSNHRFAPKRPFHETDGITAGSLQRSVVLTSNRLLPIRSADLNGESDPINACAQVVPSYSHGAATLLDLSNEILEKIAQYVQGSPTIMELSLVNRRLRDTAQDTMLRNLYVSKTGIRRVLEMLAANSDRIQKVRCLDLCKYGCMHLGNCHALGSIVFDARTARSLCNSIDQNTMHRVTWLQIQQAKAHPTHWFNKAHSLFLNILVALCSMLKELTMWLPVRQDFAQTRPPAQALSHSYDSVTPFEGPALEVLQRNLEVLTFKCGFRCTGNAIRLIRLPGFRNLKSLTMPMDNLGSPKMIDFYEPDGVFIKSRQGDDVDRAAGRLPCLPLTLINLRLTSCNKHTFRLLDVLNCLPAGTLRLKHISLSFDVSACSALVKCAAGRWPDPIKVTARRWRRRVEDLVSKGHDIELCAKQSLAVYNHGRKASFLEELSALTILSRHEVAEIAAANMQLSDCTALNDAGPRQRQSRLEVRLFVLHGIDHIHLFCSPTFDATFWSSVAFFHGSRDVSMKHPTRVTIDQPDFFLASMKRKLSPDSGVPDLTISAFSTRIRPYLYSLPRPVVVPSSSVPRPAIKNRCITPEETFESTALQSTLIFNSSAEFRTSFYTQQSDFMESEFRGIAWMWYLQPRIETVGEGLKASKNSSHKGSHVADGSEKRRRQ